MQGGKKIMLNLQEQVGALLDAQNRIQEMIDAGEGDINVLNKEWNDLKEAIECILEYC